MNIVLQKAILKLIYTNNLLFIQLKITIEIKEYVLFN